jgi:hypothetical protein
LSSFSNFFSSTFTGLLLPEPWTCKAPWFSMSKPVPRFWNLKKHKLHNLSSSHAEQKVHTLYAICQVFWFLPLSSTSFGVNF